MLPFCRVKKYKRHGKESNLIKGKWAPTIKFSLNSFPFIANKACLLSVTFFAEIKTKQEKIDNNDENRWQSMIIDTQNFLGDRFSSISDINRLINIDFID